MFDRVLNASSILSLYMKIRMPAFSFTSKTGCSKLISNHHFTHIEIKSINYKSNWLVLHERDCDLEWVEKWVKFLRNTWWNFCFPVKLLKYLIISAIITCLLGWNNHCSVTKNYFFKYKSGCCQSLYLCCCQLLCPLLNIWRRSYLKLLLLGTNKFCLKIIALKSSSILQVNSFLICF